MHEKVEVPDLYGTVGYTHAVMAGDILFTSGIVARDGAGQTVGKGDFEAQAHRVYENLGVVLKAAGATWDDVAKYSACVARAEDWERSRVIHHGYLPRGGSAGATIVAPLMDPELLYELDVIAHVGGSKQCLPGAVKVDGTIYLDAQEGASGELGTQVEAVYRAFGDVLERCGVGWGDLVWSYGFATGHDAIRRMRDIRYRYMRAGEVAQTSFVCGLGTPDVLFRSELVATTALRRAFTVPGVSISPGVAHAVKVGNMVYVQGQVARDAEDNPVAPGDMEAQAERVFHSLDMILRATGASWGDVVRIKTIMTDPAQAPEVHRVRDDYLGGMAYTSAALVGGFFAPEYMLEIEAVAVVG